MKTASSQETNRSLSGIKIAILATDGVEQVELTSPRQAYDDAGAKTSLISPLHTIRAWDKDRWGESFVADIPLKNADARDYDALYLPGGVMNPDSLRMNPQAVAFVKAFFEAGKPIGAICHGPWLLVEANIISGKKLTSYPSLKTDIKNAGGTWLDQEVIVDGTLITSRKPDDIPAFIKATIDAFSRH